MGDGFLSFGFIFTGAVIGFLSGMFGIGGSIISTPVLKIIFGIPDLIAIASPLPVIIPTAIGGIWGYWQKKMINLKIAFIAIICGLPATIAGAYLTKIIDSFWLMLLTGFLVIHLGIRLFLGKDLINSRFKSDSSVFIKAGLIGLLSGFLSGLLAIGGGIILIPGFILILGLSMQEAISTSLFCIAFFALPATIVHSCLGHINWHIVLNLSIGVIPASYLGSKAGIALGSKFIRPAFSIFLILFGIYFILKQVNIL